MGMGQGVDEHNYPWIQEDYSGIQNPDIAMGGLR